MKIFITCPNPVNPHGGIKIICTWANLLSKYHEINLHFIAGKKPDWFTVSDNVKIVSCEKIFDCDCVILTSPHASNFLKLILPHQKCFIFLQMMEEMFNPTDVNWLIACNEMYQSPHSLISISKWNMRVISERYKCKGIMHYIGNGVDLPVSHVKKEEKTVLIEGWEACNPTKDTDKISHTVALRLKNEGYKIIVYSGIQLRTDQRLPHEVYIKPSQQKLSDLYSRATILIKASKYDARSCSPVEAYTKGTVTARAIIEGDDDLISEVNCLRCGYNAEELYKNAKRLLTDKVLRETLLQGGMQLDWGYWIDAINRILTDKT